MDILMNQNSILNRWPRTLSFLIFVSILFLLGVYVYRQIDLPYRHSEYSATLQQLAKTYAVKDNDALLLSNLQSKPKGHVNSSKQNYQSKLKGHVNSSKQNYQSKLEGHVNSSKQNYQSKLEGHVNSSKQNYQSKLERHVISSSPNYQSKLEGHVISSSPNYQSKLEGHVISSSPNYQSKFEKQVNSLSLNHDSKLDGHVACLNSGFKANRSVSVWTMLTDSKNYIKGAIKLGKSVLRHSNISVDLVIMELSNKPLTDADKVELQKVGWKICTVKRIKPRNEAGTYPRFRDQFTKLHLWNMTSYNTTIYLDSDTLVVNNIDHLISMNLNSSLIGVTRDIMAGVWKKTFNMGVFLIHPNETEFKRLYALKEDPNVTFETSMSEQGFLNVVYADQWHEIGFIYNANLAAYSQKRKYWDDHQNDIRIIHFTMEKPWQCGNTYSAVCDRWRKAP